MPPIDGLNNEIPVVTFPSEQLQFSFKHVECDHAHYSLNNCSVEYWQLFIRELKRYDGWDIDEFLNQNNDDARHIVDSRDARVDTTWLENLITRFEYADVWQFGLGHRGFGRRVFGLLVGATFYVVLFDANNDVYTNA